MKKSYAKVCITHSTTLNLFQQDEGTTSLIIDKRHTWG
jgi:hypothetical protein